MDFDLQSLSESFGFIKQTTGILKDLRDLIPKSADRKKLESTLEKAEREFALIETNVAHVLGYQLCRCSFPPQIMLLEKDNPSNSVYECPACHRTIDTTPKPKPPKKAKVKSVRW